MEKATFGAGCFWGVEKDFREVPGVIDAAVGYAGGTTENPTYEQVCTGTTGHAEAVQVMFNPEITSFEKLLAAFWDLHDPTQKDRQGPDIGTQYRSVIFYYNDEQKKLAEESKKIHSEKLGKDIATTIEPIKEFYRAEDYHQRYLEKKQPSMLKQLLNELKKKE